MNANETTKRRRRLDSSPREEVETAAADVSRDDEVSRLERRMDLMEANHRREISALRQVDEDLLARNKAVESQLSSMQEENDRLKARVSQLDEENRKLEAAFKLHVENLDWKYGSGSPV